MARGDIGRGSRGMADNPWATGERQRADEALAMRKLMAAVAVAIALAVLAVMAAGWKALGQVEMSTAGWIALVVGAVLSLAVGAGLTLLMVYSNRAGFDERAQNGRSDDENR
jgi:hypothetical protein